MTYYHNGSVIFDRLLNEDEQAHVFGLFTDCKDDDQIEIGTYQATKSSQKVSALDFNDFCEGSSFEDSLNELTRFCKEQNIGIDKDSLISFYGDADGAFAIVGGEVLILDRDELGVLQSDSEYLRKVLEERDRDAGILHLDLRDFFRGYIQNRREANPDYGEGIGEGQIVDGAMNFLVNDRQGVYELLDQVAYICCNYAINTFENGGADK